MNSNRNMLEKDSKYSPVMTASLEWVEQEPERFIIKECLDACKILWSKNIYTYMVSDELNESSWIEINENALSEENKDIYINLDCEDIIKFSYHKGCINFGVKHHGLEAKQKLVILANQFKMQDVVNGLAYISEEQFLEKYCGCSKEIENIEYEYMEYPTDITNYEEYDKYCEWEDSIRSEKFISVYDASKVLKTINEYAEEHNMIVEDGRVYLSEFHYNKHLNYVNSLEYNKHFNI